MKSIIGCFGTPIEPGSIYDLAGERGFKLLGFTPGQCLGLEIQGILKTASGLVIGSPVGPEAMAIFLETVAGNERFLISPKPIAVIAPEDIVSGLDVTMISLLLQRGVLPPGASRYVKVFATSQQAVDWLANSLTPANGHKVSSSPIKSLLAVA